MLNSTEHDINHAHNVKILIFINMINTTSERLKARISFLCNEQLKFHAQLS